MATRVVLGTLFPPVCSLKVPIEYTDDFFRFIRYKWVQG